MQLEIQEIAALLDIYERSLGHPQLANIRAEAWSALLKLDAEHAKPASTEPVPGPAGEPLAEPEAEPEAPASTLDRRV